MKKTAKRPMHTRLRSIDDARLATVSGGASMEELRGRYEPGSGWWEFYNGAAANDGLTCTPRWN